MKIGSMDASANYMTKISNSETNTGSSTSNVDSKNINVEDIENKNISLITDNEKSELPFSEKFLIDAIEKANKAINGSNRAFEVAVHEKTKDVMVKVIDTETKEVVREFPPKKILDVIAKIWEMAGIMVDERR